MVPRRPNNRNTFLSARGGGVVLPTQWFRIGELAGADGDAVSAVSDGLGGTGWVMATAGLQPQVRLAGSGQKLLQFNPDADGDGTAGDGMTLAVQASVNNHRNQWGWLQFFKPENISAGSRHFIGATSPSGGAGAQRMVFGQNAANLFFQVYIDASNSVQGTTTTAPLVAGDWIAIGCFFIGGGNGNAGKMKIFAGSGFETLTFSNPSGSGDAPSQLVAVTSGNYRIGMGNAAGGNAIKGLYGPDAYIFNAVPSVRDITTLLSANIPVG